MSPNANSTISQNCLHTRIKTGKGVELRRPGITRLSPQSVLACGWDVSQVCLEPNLNLRM